MVSAQDYGDSPDVTSEYYNEVDSQYGRCIEGTLPDGFKFAGRAAFSGEDTIPDGQLARNEGEADVYYNSDDPTVILVETHWFTAGSEEGCDETQHNGYNVYLLYDCPFRAESETAAFHGK